MDVQIHIDNIILVLLAIIGLYTCIKKILDKFFSKIKTLVSSYRRVRSTKHFKEIKINE